MAFALKRRSAFQAIAAGYLADQFAALPIRKDAVQVFARNAGHSGEVGLFDLLTDHNAILANALAEVSASSRSVTATRPRSGRKLSAAMASLVSRKREASSIKSCW